jgi:hypothetical protein
MISSLLKGLGMPEADDERVIFILCEWTAGTLVYFSILGFLAGEVLKGIILAVLAVLFAVVGVKWPAIKQKTNSRFSQFAPSVERIARNRLYRRTIYSGITFAILLSGGLRVYHYYYHRYHPTIQSTETDTSAPLVPLQPLQSLTVSPVKLGFRDQPIGKTSSAQTVTVINQGTAPRIIAGMSITGTFSQTNDCGPELMTGDSCDVEVTFTPAAPGLTYGNLEISCKDPLFPSVNLAAIVTFSGSGKTSPAQPTLRHGTTINATTNAPYSAAVGINTGTVNVGPQPREVDATQQDALVTMLSTRHGSISIDIHNPVGDTESYANHWLSMFHKARWSTIGVGKLISGTDIGPSGEPVQIPKGLHIYYKPAQKELAAFVAETIKSHPPEEDTSIGDVDLRLFVGDQESDQTQRSGPPPGIIPQDPVKAVEVVDRMRRSLIAVISKKETVTFLITWPKDDNSNLVFVSNLISQACRESPRQCWFTQEGNPQDLDKPPVQASGRPGITVHGADAYALASALGTWFITHSTSTVPRELDGYKENSTKEMMWIEIGPGSPWKLTTK